MKYKVDTGNDGYLMSVGMFKYYSQNQQWQCIPEMDVCRVTITYKGKQKPCGFFIIPGRRQVLLGIPDVEKPELLNVNCKHNRAKLG